MASPAVFSVFVTQGYAGEVGRDVDAAFACNLDPVVIGDVDQAIERHGWRHGERRQDCDASESAPHGFLSGWKRVWRRVRAENRASPPIPHGRLESECARRLETRSSAGPGRPFRALIVVVSHLV